MPRYFLGADGNQIVERRATPRYELALRVEIRFGDGGNSIEGMTSNISESGVQVLMPTAIPRGTALDFACPSFAGTVEAIWSRDEGEMVRTGFRFVSLSSKDRSALQAVLTNVQPEPAREPVPTG